MKCEDIRNLLTRHLLNELDEQRAAEVRSHLEQCDGCRAEAQSIEPTLDLLRDALAADTSAPRHLSDERRARILAALPGEPAPAPVRSSRPRPSFAEWLAGFFRKPAVSTLIPAVLLLLLLLVPASMLLPALHVAGRSQMLKGRERPLERELILLGDDLAQLPHGPVLLERDGDGVSDAWELRTPTSGGERSDTGWKTVSFGSQGPSPDGRHKPAAAPPGTYVLTPERSGIVGGLVEDAEYGGGVPKARVRPPDLDTEVQTDSDGGFTIKGVGLGEHRIELSKPGYKLHTQSSTLAKPHGDKEVAVKLKNEFAAMEEFVARDLDLKNGDEKATLSVQGQAFQESRRKVPILGDIPLIGQLFRSEESQKVTAEEPPPARRAEPRPAPASPLHRRIVRYEVADSFNPDGTKDRAGHGTHVEGNLVGNGAVAVGVADTSVDSLDLRSARDPAKTDEPTETRVVLYSGKGGQVAAKEMGRGTGYTEGFGLQRHDGEPQPRDEKKKRLKPSKPASPDEPKIVTSFGEADARKAAELLDWHNSGSTYKPDAPERPVSDLSSPVLRTELHSKNETVDHDELLVSEELRRRPIESLIDRTDLRPDGERGEREDRKREETGLGKPSRIDGTDLDRVEETREKEREEPETGPRFKAVGVNPFLSPATQRFSTFAIDVDTASYTLARRYMSQGFLPPAESVRTEEFVNFFDYAYTPACHKTFRVDLECAPSRFGRGLYLLKIGVKGRRLGREEQRPAVLTFLVDTSGSMNKPDRIGLVKKALGLLVDRLSPRDRVAIVQYGSHARLILEHSPASQRARIHAAIRGLQCSGSTNIEEGMAQAYAVAARNFRSGAENRVLLLSDGVANLGSVEAESILAKVEAFRRQGVYCSVFGFGTGTYDDTMLETLADKGNGAYAFLDSEEEARRVFVNDLAATLNTIATDVKIQVEFDPARVRRFRQIGYENRQLKKEQFRDNTVDAGEVGSGQSVTALYELELKPGTRSQDAGSIAVVRVRYRRVDTGGVEEIERPLGDADITAHFDSTSPRFRLAACAAEFSEILRASPHAAGSRYEDVARVLRPVALELSLDQRVQELLRLVQGASGMSRGAL